MACSVLNIKITLANRHYNKVLLRYGMYLYINCALCNRCVLIQWNYNVQCIIKRRLLLTTALIYQHNTLINKVMIYMHVYVRVCVVF